MQINWRNCRKLDIKLKTNPPLYIVFKIIEIWNNNPICIYEDILTLRKAKADRDRNNLMNELKKIINTTKRRREDKIKKELAKTGY